MAWCRLFYCWFYLILQYSGMRTASATVVITVPEPSNYYTAAVFEYNRKGNVTADSPSEIVNLNLDYYERATQVASSKGADIIIFPEYGITSFAFANREYMKQCLEEVPDPRKVSSNPCEQQQEFANRPMLYRLSCMAKHNNIVVVANTGDIQACTKEDNPNCPDDGSFHFNANVAFDRDGKILAKYQKEHLFYEFGMDLPQEPQHPVFTTDFGTFAMYICFDTMWKPIVDSAQMENIDNIILSTMWIEVMPFWIAPQWWESFALGNNVNHLVSNINIPGYSAVGSGVFTSHMGALKYTYNPDGVSKLVISRVPKSKHQRFPFPNFDSSITVITENGTEPYDEENDGKDVPDQCSDKIVGDINKDYQCFHENMVNYTFVKLTKPQDRLEACSNGMCCSLEYSADAMTETYYLGVSNGTYELFHRYYLCEENCLVVRCDAVNGTECTNFPMKANTVFNQLQLRSNFSTPFVYPSVLKSGARLAPVSEWTHGINKADNIEAFLKYDSSSQQPLLVAGLKGRCFDRDPPYRR